MLTNLGAIQKIKQLLSDSRRILLVTHQNPDGDGLGAVSALAQYLKKLNKDYVLFCKDEPPANYQFIPLFHQLTADPAVFSRPYDLVIVMDAGDLKYAGIDDLLQRDKFKTLINIDHHLSNNHFGDVNLVLPEASSASEIIYQLFRLWKVTVDKDMATALLNGIVFDTGVFSNSGTTLPSLQAASHLLNIGARHAQINKNILRNKSLGLLKLWGRAFERLEYNPGYDLAFTVITLKDIVECGAEPESASGLSNFFNELAGAKAVMVLVEQPDGAIKGSFRTTRDDVDVARLAKTLGGGGHQKAAGFSVSGRLVYNEGRWFID
ncbi:MAG TPA: bifunctional oligoribonuclease/PAP phosphatase NrnA [Patescibacteria group bacterium]|nr:bifunctional oligoribonuclease/PAP phosphatase NrnA [Patescibacteria group bacterium]